MAQHVRTMMMAGVMAGASVLGLGAMHGCGDTGRAAANVTPVRVKGQTFYLELAVNDEARVPGLGKRTHIDDDGGMIFCFPDARLRSFVMRDCLVPIDIIFTDGTGRALQMHAMQVEAPRGPGEGQVGDLNNPMYGARLKQYECKFPSQFAIELKGGMIEKLGVKEGDKLEFDYESLKKIAR